MESIEQDTREYRKPGDVKVGDRAYMYGTWVRVVEVVVGQKTVALVAEVPRQREDLSLYTDEKIHELAVDEEVLVESGGAS